MYRLSTILNRRTSKRKIAWLTSVIVLVVVVTHFQMIWYSMQQLKGQVKILVNTTPIDDVMADSSVADSVKQKLAFIDSVKKFTQKELGFEAVNTYTSLYDQEGKPILWVLTAAPKDELIPYEWKYPILGKMGYKGFFERESLMEEKEKLKKMGFEVCEGEVQAWSTLGILPDPVLSNMLTLPNDLLARLVIHELTHTQVFISGDAELNENFATFIGTQGARLFLQKQYGDSTKKLERYNRYFEDVKKITDFILDQRKELEKLYHTHRRNKKGKLLKEQKVAFFKSYKMGLTQLSLHRPEEFEQFLHPDSLPKNCFFNDIGMYRNKQVQFDAALRNQFHGSLKAMVLDYKEKYGNEINPFLSK